MTDNVYKKLLTLRARVQGELSKDGHNAYVKFNYFKLDDILTVITPIMVELGLFDHTDFAWDVGRGVYVCRHTVINVDGALEDGELDMLQTQFDIHHDAIKGQVAQQAAGSSYTYARRYIWQMLLALTEPNSDPDQLNVGKGTVPKAEPKLISEDALAAIHKAGRERTGDEWDEKAPKMALWASSGDTNVLANLTEEQGQAILKAWQTS